MHVYRSAVEKMVFNALVFMFFLNQKNLERSDRTGTSDTPICECGFERESSEHFLLPCSRHLQARNQLKDALNDISDASSCRKRLQLYICQKTCCWHRCGTMLQERKMILYQSSTFPVPICYILICVFYNEVSTTA